MAKFLSVAGRAGVAKVMDPLGRILIGLGVSPNVITLLGTTVIVGGAVYFVPRGQLLAGLIVITVAAFTDLLDGAMARARGTASRFGALLDSTMDRIADGAIFGSLAYYLATSGDHPSAAAALICLVGAEVVSYVKSRAESLGTTCNVGIAERAERLVIIGVGTVLTVIGVPHAMPVAVWTLAVLTAITVVQRVWYVRGRLDNVDKEERQ